MMLQSGLLVPAFRCDNAKPGQGTRHRRVRGPEQFPPNRQSLPMAGFGRFEIAKIAADDSEIVQAGGHVGMAGPEHAASDRQRRFMMLARRRLFAECRLGDAQIGKRCRRLRMGMAVCFAEQRQSTLEELPRPAGAAQPERLVAEIAQRLCARAGGLLTRRALH
jgi:hypothetical protein